MYEQYTDKQIVEMLEPKLNKCTAQIDWNVVTSEPDSLWDQMFWGDILKAISIVYRSGYIRGQLGRSFIIGEKKKKSSDTVFQVGDSVKLINKKGIDKKDNRYLPPIGTTGKVAELGSDYCFVQWPEGITAGDGMWACPNHFLEKVVEHWVPATKDNVKVGSKVRFVNERLHKKKPQYFPCKGTIGEVKTVCKDELCDVQWPKGTTSDMDWWVTKWEDLEVLLCE